MRGESVGLGAMEVVQQAWGWLDERITAEVHTLWRWGSGTELTSTSSTRGLPFVDSPAPIVVAVAIYLTIVVGGLLWINANNLKPREKEPVPLQALVLVHNLFCFALSLYMCVGIVREAIIHKYVTLVVVVTLPYLTFLPFWNCVVSRFGIGFVEFSIQVEIRGHWGRGWSPIAVLRLGWWKSSETKLAHLHSKCAYWQVYLLGESL